MKRIASVLFALFFISLLASCEYLGAVNEFSQSAVEKACGQPEVARDATRRQLASWGLWVKCVPADTDWRDFELSPVGPAPATGTSQSAPAAGDDRQESTPPAPAVAAAPETGAPPASDGVVTAMRGARS